MHIQANVISAVQPPLAAVDPHPHPDRRIGRPLLPSQPALRLQCSPHRRRCIGERVEQRIALRAHLRAGRAERFAQYAMVIRQQLRIPIT